MKMILTKQEAIYYHKQLWTKLKDWIQKQDITTLDSSMLNNQKRRICSDLGIGIVHYHCVLCEYAIQQNNRNHEGRCRYCPVVWRSTSNEYMCMHTSNDHLDDGIVSEMEYLLDEDEVELDDLLYMCDVIINLPERRDKK